MSNGIETKWLIDKAEVVSTNGVNYKAGFVRCECGWRKDLGDGFNQYYIKNCPACTPELHTRRQAQVTLGRPRKYTIQHGDYCYFVLSNGIHIQFSGITVREERRKSVPQ